MSGTQRFLHTVESSGASGHSLNMIRTPSIKGTEARQPKSTLFVMGDKHREVALDEPSFKFTSPNDMGFAV